MGSASLRVQVVGSARLISSIQLQPAIQKAIDHGIR
jgi:hypothetical protein